MRLKVSEKTASQIETCAFCYLMCRHYCTIASVQRVNYSTPRGKALILYEIVNGRIKMDRELARIFYLCTNCGRCYIACETKASNPPEIFEEVRSAIVSEGLAPEEVEQVVKSLQKLGDRLVDEALVEDEFLDGKSEYLYYLGGEIRNAQVEIAQKTLALLKLLKVDVKIMREEPDDGAMFYLLGYRDLAEKAAKNLLSKLRKNNVRKLIVSDPLSYMAFKVYYPKLGLSLDDIEIMHLTEFLANKKIPSGKLKATTVYHDPCFLGRRSAGIYEEPRELLRRIPGLELKELTFNREHSLCCGGLLRPIDEYWANKIAMKLADELRSLEVDFVTTACPRCKASLNQAGIKAYDIAEVLVESLSGVS